MRILVSIETSPAMRYSAHHRARGKRLEEIGLGNEPAGGGVPPRHLFLVEAGHQGQHFGFEEEVPAMIDSSRTRLDFGPISGRKALVVSHIGRIDHVVCDVVPPSPRVLCPSC
jgi:hypothetical protein